MFLCRNPPVTPRVNANFEIHIDISVSHVVLHNLDWFS